MWASMHRPACRALPPPLPHTHPAASALTDECLRPRLRRRPEEHGRASHQQLRHHSCSLQRDAHRNTARTESTGCTYSACMQGTAVSQRASHRRHTRWPLGPMGCLWIGMHLDHKQCLSRRACRFVVGCLPAAAPPRLDSPSHRRHVALRAALEPRAPVRPAPTTRAPLRSGEDPVSVGCAYQRPRAGAWLLLAAADASNEMHLCAEVQSWPQL